MRFSPRLQQRQAAKTSVETFRASETGVRSAKWMRRRFRRRFRFRSSAGRPRSGALRSRDRVLPRPNLDWRPFPIADIEILVRTDVFFPSRGGALEKGGPRPVRTCCEQRLRGATNRKNVVVFHSFGADADKSAPARQVAPSPIASKAAYELQVRCFRRQIASAALQRRKIETFRKNPLLSRSVAEEA